MRAGGSHGDRPWSRKRLLIAMVGKTEPSDERPTSGHESDFLSTLHVSFTAGRYDFHSKVCKIEIAFGDSKKGGLEYKKAYKPSIRSCECS